MQRPKRSTKRGGARPGAGRPKLAHGRSRDVSVRLGEDEIETLEAIQDAYAPLSPQSAIRYLIAQERDRQDRS